ncbi:anti-sigma regulatory factor [Rhabdobacter roseus]|uniref:Anti-sigma regulatory factor (Ser/Thr protein kinase) n=1 Tax=Rhabdobacter roseus TaxID=1655419 RepID=A0A840TP06_9BACT|nr:ATP-binding protein [Rhabdobacter roseus]MBB5285084.1 anti-sigma regulatory factor (Ser/Thr protein kinase) [Rhabdobacter roseus]
METKSFPGTVDSLDSIREYAGQVANEVGLSKKPTYALKLAVDEIATNIILYGFERVGMEGTIEMSSEVVDGKLMLVIEDAAAPFDPLARELPNEEDLTQTLEEREIGGLGIFLTINGVDEFRYEFKDGKNRNIFVMNLE